MNDASGINFVFDNLLSYYGPRGWWPADSTFEVIVGAILTQNTNWSNVEKAMINLKKSGNLDIQSIAIMDVEKLANLIRPSGFFSQKSKRLQSFCRFIIDNFGSIEKMFQNKPDELRKIFLEQKGIGPETADSILLYAGNLPFFVIDTYTKRIFTRLGYTIRDDYESFRFFFESNLPKDSALFNEYHALIVEHAKRFCKNTPLCGECPLRKLCEFGKG